MQDILKCGIIIKIAAILFGRNADIIIETPDAEREERG